MQDIFYKILLYGIFLFSKIKIPDRIILFYQGFFKNANSILLQNLTTQPQ
jgi:hypothetical protein